MTMLHWLGVFWGGLEAVPVELPDLPELVLPGTRLASEQCQGLGLSCILLSKLAT